MARKSQTEFKADFSSRLKLVFLVCQFQIWCYNYFFFKKSNKKKRVLIFLNMLLPVLQCQQKIVCWPSIEEWVEGPLERSKIVTFQNYLVLGSKDLLLRRLKNYPI